MTDSLPVPIDSFTEVITVANLIDKVSKHKKIDLNPIYQRDVVWNEPKMSAFIDSLMKGYVPSNITVNIDTSSTLWTCVDGKQRITAIMNFYRNKIPWVRTDEEDEDLFIYFNHVPEDKQDEKNYVHLDKKQQKFYLERSAIVVTYNDLTYSMQCEIFNRIQNSMATTSGEQCFSLFRNPVVAAKFKEFCRKNDYANRTRFRNVEIILNIFYMKQNRELKSLSGRKEKKKFIDKLDELEEYDRVVELIEEDLKIYFSDDLMAHKDMLNKKITKNFVIVLFYLISLEKKKLNTLEKKDFPAIRKMIEKIWGKWNIVDGEINKDKSKMSTKVLEKIEKLYDKNNSAIIHPDKKSTKDKKSDNDDNSDDKSDQESADGSDVGSDNDSNIEADETPVKLNKSTKKIVISKDTKKIPTNKTKSIKLVKDPMQKKDVSGGDMDDGKEDLNTDDEMGDSDGENSQHSSKSQALTNKTKHHNKTKKNYKDVGSSSKHK